MPETHKGERILKGSQWEPASWQKYVQRSPPSAWDPLSYLRTPRGSRQSCAGEQRNFCPGFVSLEGPLSEMRQPAGTYPIQIAWEGHSEQGCPYRVSVSSLWLQPAKPS